MSEEKFTGKFAVLSPEHIPHIIEHAKAEMAHYLIDQMEQDQHFTVWWSMDIPGEAELGAWESRYTYDPPTVDIQFRLGAVEKVSVYMPEYPSYEFGLYMDRGAASEKEWIKIRPKILWNAIKPHMANVFAKFTKESVERDIDVFCGRE